MKKGLFLCLAVIILNMSLISALSISLNKESYSAQETLLALVEGEFSKVPVLSDVSFFREYREVPVPSDILKINNKVYLYALLPNRDGNYSIKIKNVRYLDDGALKEEDLIKNFTINQTNETIIQANPGFIFAKGSFYFSLENKGSQAVDLSVKFFDQKQDFSLSPSNIRKIEFSIQGIKQTSGEITVSSKSKNLYKIPVIIIPIPNNDSDKIEPYQFGFKERTFNATLSIGKKWMFQQELFNYALVDMDNIKLKIIGPSGILDLNPEKISLLKPGQGFPINITISPDKIGNFQAIIQASFNDLTTNLSVNIDFTENESHLPPTPDRRTCEYISGKTCGADEFCSIPTTIIGEKNEECCLGSCDKLSSGVGKSFWIGLLIFFAVLGIVAAIYFYVKNRKISSPEDIITKRTERFEKSHQINSPSSAKGSVKDKISDL